MSAVLHFIAIIVTALAFLFVIIGESTDHWYESDITVGNFFSKSNAGLWRSCNEQTLSPRTCKDIGSSDDKLRAVRAFTILALIALGAAVFDLIVVFKIKSWIIGQIISSICAVVFLIIGLSIYTDEGSDVVKVDGFKWGYSFILAWLGFVLSLISVPCGIGFHLMAKD